MRRSHLLALAFALTAAGVIAGCSGSDSTAPVSSVLPSRTVDAGAVEVVITPTRLDAGGATFAIVLDTHSVDLSLDLTTSAVLVVGDATWTAAEWTGSEQGGHHREGELRFDAEGPLAGTALLTISGLPSPVEVSWDVGGG